ncbi:alpha-E domain-containing protein, partial [[Ruminococcus] torques]|uniref:alpha-E domain-containing protein n=1 Tax=[Ruminococcus] torques TaxID=33039 RepID=UPI001EDE92F5
LCTRAIDPDAPTNSARQSSERLKKLLVAWGAVPARFASRSPAEVAKIAVWDADSYGSARSIAGAARRAASIIRERLSHDTWRLVD